MNRIICGDALEVLDGISGNSVHLIITSPPYNLGKGYSGSDDLLPYGEYLDWLGSVWSSCARVLVRGGRLCINIGENKRRDITYPAFSVFIRQCIDLGLLYRGTIIWNKHSAARHCAWGSWNSCSDPHIVPRHEYIIIFSKGSFRLEGDKVDCDLSSDGVEFMRCTRSVWDMGTASKKRVNHPAPFPLELPRRLIKFYSYCGNVILDPFGGSGTVGLAALELGRHFILIDSSADYCNLALERINGVFGSLLLGVDSGQLIEQGVEHFGYS